jgi:hypothetical protein
VTAAWNGGGVKETLTTTGHVIYGTVMVIASLVDVAVTTWLFASGNVGWGVTYGIIGFTTVLAIGHWIGLVLAAPFVQLSERREQLG